MIITLTWNDFQALNKFQGPQILYVKDANNDVTKCAILYDVYRTETIFVFANPPGKQAFLAIYPAAVQVNDLT
jgi:hypothetical protein